MMKKFANYYSTTALRDHRTTLLLFGWMGLLPLLSSSVVSYEIIQHEHWLATLSWELWLVIGFISCFAMGFAILPTSLMALLAGYFLGFGALPGMIVAYTISSLIGFQITRWFDRGTLVNTLSQLPPKQVTFARQLQAGVAHNQLGLTALVRMSPIMPFTIMNVLLPLVGVSLRNYLLGGWIGMLPRTFFLIWLGNQAQEIRFLIKHEGDISVQLFMAGMVLVTLIGTGYYAKRIFQQQVKEAAIQK
ncbi:MAG: VTT domain-containing protein [Bacteroidota bacterium]